jgi:DEAD/DEAH box helicase domain-containing protein
MPNVSPLPVRDLLSTPSADAPESTALALRGSVEHLVGALQRKYAGRITGELIVPPQDATYAEFPETLDPAIRTALNRRGITRLYSHQREAWGAIEAGEDVVVVTPTASGKTLCYNLPVLQHARDARAKALYLFPTKALAQDQVAELNELNRAGELGVRAYTFDGDTPGDARRAVRTKGDVVVTNPDMLHTAILPHHTKWAQFFESLAFIVIDEVHGYRGVFGSHVANVIRRLRRVCAFYGVAPRFILCSATIGNPQEHAQNLLGSPVRAITKSGAPQGGKHLLLWNPPVVNPDLGIRASNRSQSNRIARAAIRAKLKTIVFCQSRLMVEILTKYLKDVFDNDPRKPARVHAYRGGYLPEERRAVERKLRAGEIDAVVSTSALELGVDIGSLDVCVLNGYPGSIAATWQRLGRAGRRQRTALGVLVAGSDALDQYIVRHPEYFIGAPPEHARIAPDQLLILLDHVRCAAFELPFRAGEAFGGQDPRGFLEFLAETGVLHGDGETWHWIADSYPANAVNLRSVADGNFLVIDRSDGKQTVLAEVDYTAAAVTLYEGAIYLIQSKPWQVEKLDWVGRKAFVTRTTADYYTDAIDYQKLKILERFDTVPEARGEASHGEVHLIRRVTGYKKIRYYSHESIGYGPVNLPDQELHTTSLWWRLPEAELTRVFPTRHAALDGFLGAAYALHTVAVLRAMAEPRDIGKAVGSGAGEWAATVGMGGRGELRDASDRPLAPESLARFEPTVFLYDNYPGGTGFSEPLFREREAIVADALQLVQQCECAHGCPACVGPVLGSDENGERAPRRDALTVLGLLAGA